MAYKLLQILEAGESKIEVAADSESGKDCLFAVFSCSRRGPILVFLARIRELILSIRPSLMT